MEMFLSKEIYIINKYCLGEYETSFDSMATIAIVAYEDFGKAVAGD